MDRQEIGTRVPEGRDPPGESGDATRTAILDAVVRCIAAQGWAGTNMSLVARETGMTRGKIQYYFPVLEDLKYAAIEYLHECWRRSYFGRIDPDAPPRLQLDMGVDLLWQQAREPLHRAMVELESAARTDERLRTILSQLHIADEQALDLETSAAFPTLAAIGSHELRLGRYFVTIFINGLAAHHFPGDAARWQVELTDMLKECLAAFWLRRGMPDLDGSGIAASSVTSDSAPARDDGGAARQREALDLLRRATELLSQPSAD
ncbi:TetR/AcrR family transcriptional regulator [Sphingobium sp. Sx8-8]|uniref:TetR/AcrR family transcriptional regulator n=1 Tax=Sphingobium sp. Sx8-8 TaxID=2933617 RepID=UPI001F58C735|nr:TetR/AcrR family transcriptional regulator [Sphingobium sp. Sx8-8]